jgi:peptide/nickel transport system ATP-binding protein
VERDIILSVRNMRTEFSLRAGLLRAVNDVSFDLANGEVIALVGESGCGKSVTVKSLLRLINKPGQVYGKALFRKDSGDMVDLIALDPKGRDIRSIRGKMINMIFQEPMNALSPVHTVANQMIEGIMLHTDMTKRQARERAIELLGMVGIPQPEKRIDSYSFQLSGGMRQRVMIAMAISCNPSLLIADEPTTALDVSMQAQILKLLRELQQKTGMSMIFITHDLAVVAQMVDRVCVMYLGEIVEEAPVRSIFEHPTHPYTKSLMASILDPGDEKTDKRIAAIEGSVPEPIDLPDTCFFRDRCPVHLGKGCPVDKPAMYEVTPGHFVRCHTAAKGGIKHDKAAGA